MEEKKSSFTTKAKEFWQGLSRTLRVEYEVLQSGLSSAQAAEATTILGDLGIPYEVEGVSSVTIRVPRGTRSEVLLQMQSIQPLLTHGLLNQSMVTLTSPLLIWTNMLI